MRIRLLGTGTPTPSLKRMSSGYLVETGERKILFDFGPGATGSAVPCGGSVFFVRDPQGADEPARLMRWTPGHRLEIAYESPTTGNAFLEEPACGGGVLTLPSYGEDGDELVWAKVT